MKNEEIVEILRLMSSKSQWFLNEVGVKVEDIVRVEKNKGGKGKWISQWKVICVNGRIVNC